MPNKKSNKSFKSTHDSRQSFSLPIALTPKKTLLIGAGAVAWQKFKVLQDSQWEVCVWAREICDKRFAPYFTESNCAESSLRGDLLPFCHTERSKVSKSRDSKINSESMSQKQIDKSHKFAQSQQIANNSKVAKMDSSLSIKAQNDEFVVDCHDSADAESRNDESNKNANSTNHATFHLIALDSTTDLQLLKPFEIIIDASGDARLGAFLHSARKECGFLLNVVDTPNLCDFYFGSIVRRENVSVMVSTNGASPILSQVLRDKISAILPKALGALSHRLKNLRQIAPPKDKKAKDSIAKECQNTLGKVLIIGCGPGDFELLTLKALESFALLDIALVDNLIGTEITAHIKGLGVECVNVGKRKGEASFTQEQINELMLHHAKSGKIVGRLKGGDPVIFGRVWEEASFLHAHNIEVEYISGITSSLCGALYSGVAPTLRGVSSGALIVSAHLRESVFHTQWLEWLKDSPYTIIVLMARSFAERVKDEALAQGISENLPAAFISHISLPSQKSIIGTLGELPQMAQSCENPSILILGKAVEESLNMPFMGERIVLDSMKKNLPTSPH